MSSFKEIIFPAQSAARDAPAFWSECGIIALFKIGQLLACILREVLAVFGIEDCVMEGSASISAASFLLDFALAEPFSNPEWVLMKPSCCTNTFRNRNCVFLSFYLVLNAYIHIFLGLIYLLPDNLSAAMHLCKLDTSHHDTSSKVHSVCGKPWLGFLTGWREFAASSPLPWWPLDFVLVIIWDCWEMAVYVALDVYL